MSNALAMVVSAPARMSTWWHARSTPAKVGIVTGAVLGAGLVTWGIFRLTRPKPVRDISDGCNDFSFANQAEVEEAIRPIVSAARAKYGSVDPFYVTTKFLKKYASECRSYPEEARNVGEAELYVQAFVRVVKMMEGERMLSPDQRQYFYEMVSVWGRTQGLGDDQLPGSGKQGAEPMPASPTNTGEEPYVPQP